MLALDAQSAFDRCLREVLVSELFKSNTAPEAIAVIENRLKNRTSWGLAVTSEEILFSFALFVIRFDLKLKRFIQNFLPKSKINNKKIKFKQIK